MKSRSRHNSTEKSFIIIIFFFTVTLRPFISTTHLPCFRSRNITKNAETHPPTMLDVIIEQSYAFFQKITSNNILHYLWSADLSKSFSQLIMLIFFFSQYFFNRYCPLERFRVTPYCSYRDSLASSVLSIIITHQNQVFIFMNYSYLWITRVPFKQSLIHSLYEF